MTRQLTGKHVLIVEDEYLIALDIAHSIAAQGAEVVGPVVTVNAALDAIAKRDVDLVILDLNLNGKLSLPVADALADRQIPFVFTTGYGIRTVPARHASASFLQKPVSPSVVCDELERILAAQENSRPASF
jgi:DNA-binding NtrC family response regulator